MKPELRKARPLDANELSAVAFAAKRHWGYPEEWIQLWMDELTVSPEYIEKNIVISAVENCRIVGWCALVDDAGSCRLDYCWVLPEAMQLGIGRQLIEQAFTLAAGLGFAAMKVIADPNALGFYQKLGFKHIGTYPSSPKSRILPVLEARVGAASNVLE